MQRHRAPRTRVLAVAVASAALLGSLAPAAADAHRLSFTAAKRAAQVRADAYANQPTRIPHLFNFGLHRYYAQAEWVSVDPIGCKGCGYDPDTESFFDTPLNTYHSIDLRVVCVGGHTAANSLRACTPRAFVTRAFA